MNPPTENPKLAKVISQLAELSSRLDSYTTETFYGEVVNSWMQELIANLRAEPELVHLLTDEQIAPLYRGMLMAREVAFAPKEKPKKEKKVTKESALAAAIDWSKAKPSIDLSDL